MYAFSRLAGLLALGLTACASLPQPTAVDVARAQRTQPAVTLESLTQARKTYVKTCSGCHALHLPAEFPGSRWPSLVEEMMTVQKVRLTRDQRQEIEQFLLAMSP